LYDWRIKIKLVSKKCTTNARNIDTEISSQVENGRLHSFKKGIKVLEDQAIANIFKTKTMN